MQGVRNHDQELGNGQTLYAYIREMKELGYSYSVISDSLSTEFGIDISEKTLCNRWNAGAFKKETTARGYCCPRCADTTVACTMSVPHIDDVVRNRSCRHCGYTWQTVEIDLDLYNLLAHGQKEVKELDLRGRRSTKPRKGKR